jgi:hypothetical protein
MANMQAAYCPGGGMGSQISLAYCDGVPYPDGSYWHTIQYGAPMTGHPYGLLSPGLQCVLGGGAIPSSPAGRVWWGSTTAAATSVAAPARPGKTVSQIDEFASSILQWLNR